VVSIALLTSDLGSVFGDFALPGVFPATQQMLHEGIVCFAAGLTLGMKIAWLRSVC
jgi:hypothetical protein